jgi:hypothetical protein
MKTYKIEPAGSSKIEAALCMFCQPGGLGETLVRNGCSQSQFAHFVAKMAHYQLVEKKRDVALLADLFEQLSACNASAAKQALAKCMLTPADDETAKAIALQKKKDGHSTKPLSPEDYKNAEGIYIASALEFYWKSQGGGSKAAVDTSRFA